MKTKAFLIVFSLILWSAVSAAQTGKKIQVTGKITDASQAPVVGAMIFAGDQNTGQVSNKKGIYKVKIAPETRSIRVMTQTGEIAEKPLNGNTVVDFSFSVNFKNGAVKATKKEDKADDQVNIGYGTIDSKDLTSPVSKIDSRKDKYVYKDIYEMLRGKPGVQVNGKSIKISQGPSTFNSGTDPLFVVDGVVVNSIDDIMPSQVRSIEILKGPSASIYGSRGANGVILITLKKAEQ
jgi:TonB-dependent SusC/RagA subfamily outer membrane receptor